MTGRVSWYRLAANESYVAVFFEPIWSLVLWSLNHKTDLILVENVQHHATKLIPELDLPWMLKIVKLAIITRIQKVSGWRHDWGAKWKVRHEPILSKNSHGGHQQKLKTDFDLKIESHVQCLQDTHAATFRPNSSNGC